MQDEWTWILARIDSNSMHLISEYHLQKNVGKVILSIIHVLEGKSFKFRRSGSAKQHGFHVGAFMSIAEIHTNLKKKCGYDVSL
jgi:hypothetical protein